VNPREMLPAAVVALLVASTCRLNGLQPTEGLAAGLRPVGTSLDETPIDRPDQVGASHRTGAIYVMDQPGDINAHRTTINIRAANGAPTAFLKLEGKVTGASFTA